MDSRLARLRFPLARSAGVEPDPSSSRGSRWRGRGGGRRRHSPGWYFARAFHCFCNIELNFSRERERVYVWWDPMKEILYVKHNNQFVTPNFTCCQIVCMGSHLFWCISSHCHLVLSWSFRLRQPCYIFRLISTIWRCLSSFSWPKLWKMEWFWPGHSLTPYVNICSSFLFFLFFFFLCMLHGWKSVCDIYVPVLLMSDHLWAWYMIQHRKVNGSKNCKLV